MRQPRSSGEWAKAIADELKFNRIAKAPALTAYRLATVINWSPKEPERRGRPALYWKNEAAVASLGIDWRTFERHRSALRKAGLIDTDRAGNLVPLCPVKTDADSIDADKTDGPYEVDLFKEPSFKEGSYEVETGTVKTDGAGAIVQQPWQSSRGGSTTTGAPAHWGRGGPG